MENESDQLRGATLLAFRPHRLRQAPDTIARSTNAVRPTIPAFEFAAERVPRLLASEFCFFTKRLRTNCLTVKPEATGSPYGNRSPKFAFANWLAPMLLLSYLRMFASFSWLSDVRKASIW